MLCSSLWSAAAAAPRAHGHAPQPSQPPPPAAVYVLLPQPVVDLTASGSVEQLTPTTLKEATLASDCTWVVFFYTQSHSTSVAAAPAFLQVANE